MSLFSFRNINPNRREFSSAKEEKEHLYISIYMPLIFVIILWIVKLFETVSHIDLAVYGNLPRHAKGLLGIITSPLIHADFNHLISNSIPFLILGFLMIYSYRKVAFKAFLFIWLASGFMVWLTGRENYHIGASNLVYGFAFFIFFSGVFRKDFQAIVLSLFVVFVYGSIVWGIFPLKPGVSWEGHLMGAFAGSFIAFVYRKVDLPPPLELDDDDDEEEEDELLINYDYKEQPKEDQK